jgi:type I restriction enzyme R subunit
LGGLRGNKEAIAETIENNVRRKIIKEHLNDPAYYEKMSKLLDELIAARRAKALDYEEYLKRIAELAKKVEVGIEDNTPEDLDTPAKRALYNNLVKIRTPENELSEGGAQDIVADLALKIDKIIREVRPDGWRGIRPRENVIKDALYSILGDVDEVEKLFLIIKEQKEY